MRNRSYRDEADYCRELAAEFVDRPERPFILGIAEAFDELARGDLHSAESIIGPLGEALTVEKLPPTDAPRWTVRRKAEVVAAVEGGLLSLEDACHRYSLSIEEFTSWKRALDRSGMPGLRVRRIQEYRDFNDRRESF